MLLLLLLLLLPAQHVNPFLMMGKLRLQTATLRPLCCTTLLLLLLLLGPYIAAGLWQA
jgi:hypothetical protein